MTTYSKFRSLAARFSDKHPLLKKSGRRLEFFLLKNGKKFFSENSASQPAYSSTLTIDPAKLKLCLTRLPKESYTLPPPGLLPGDWDSHTAKIDDDITLSSFKSHFWNSTPWNETDFYKINIKDIEKNIYRFNCRSESEFQLFLNRLDLYFQNPADTENKNEKDTFSQTSIAIDHRGRLLLADEGVGLAMSKVLKLSSIKAKVRLRHTKWNDFKKEILHQLATTSGRAYQGFLHPDLKNIPALHGDHRFELINSHLPKNNGTALDLGAHWGYFSQKLESLGFQCTAYEISPTHVYFMDKLRVSMDSNFTIVQESFLDKNPEGKFDVVLALNVFHHLIKQKSTFIKLEKFLNQIDASLMFFEPEISGSAQMRDAYKNFSPEEFVNFIIENSRFTKSQFIGYAEGPNPRPIYLIQ